MKEYPTQEQIKKILDYDPTTGIFVWKKRPIDMFKPGKWQLAACNRFNNSDAGKVAGRADKNGYVSITVYPIKTHCLAHRLAWIYIYGVTPIELDHKNKNRSDNAITNLREIGHQGNAMNYSINKTNTSGVNGVSYSNRYKA